MARANAFEAALGSGVRYMEERVTSVACELGGAGDARARTLAVLAEQFARSFAAELGQSSTPVLTPAARALLVAHAWPGNVRELRNAIEYASAVCPDDVILVEHLPPKVRAAVPRAAVCADADALPETGVPADLAPTLPRLEDVERAHVLPDGRGFVHDGNAFAHQDVAGGQGIGNTDRHGATPTKNRPA